LLLAYKDLDASSPIPDVQKVNLALNAALDDTAGGTDFGRGLLLRRHRANLADGPMTVKTSAPGIETELLNPAQLVDSAGLKCILGS
jgi:hypothetical protein